MNAAATRAADVLAHAGAGPARLGAGRLICIDGPAGSGKTTLAAQVHGLSRAPVVHLDDLYPGWDGMFSFEPEVRRLLEPLATGDRGSYRRFDWAANEYRETHQLDPVPLLVMEGVGAGNRAWQRLVTTLVWVEAPADVRLARGLARDGDRVRDRWLAWMRDEERLFAEQDTRARADLVVTT